MGVLLCRRRRGGRLLSSPSSRRGLALEVVQRGRAVYRDDHGDVRLLQPSGGAAEGMRHRGLLSCLLRVSRRRVWRRGAGVRALRGDRAVRPS